MSFRLMPLIWKLTESSRLPAVIKELAPSPRLGAVRLPAVSATTPPGVSTVRSRKWRPFKRKLLHRGLVDDLADRDGLRFNLLTPHSAPGPSLRSTPGAKPG